MIAENSLIDSLSRITNKNSDEIKKLLQQKGDLGDVSKEIFQTHNANEKKQTNKEPLKIDEVIQTFKNIYQIQGEGTKLKKEEIILKLMSRCIYDVELLYLIRILQQNLRIGVGQKTIIKALNQIQDNEKLNQLKNTIEDEIFGYQFTETKNKGNAQIKVGTPVLPMLAKALPDIDDLQKFLKKFESKLVNCEFKYDGERTQIHYSDGKVDLFSRRQEKQNEKFPNLVQSLQTLLKQKQIKNCIIDGEIVIQSKQTGKILSFQDQQNRKKKLSEEEKISIQQNTQQDNDNVETVFIFDILLLNDQQLMKEPLPKRIEIYKKTLSDTQFLKSANCIQINLSDSDYKVKVKNFLSQSLDKGFEGLLIKSLDSKTFYDSNGRTQWAKLKKFQFGDQIQGKHQTYDTLDLVPIAAYWGLGKRSGRFGAYLLSAYDDKDKSFHAICKIGTGFSDDFLETTTNQFKKSIIEEKPEKYQLNKKFKPDVWLKPTTVWEIKADQFTLSPIYNIGKNIINQTQGLSLRFPRFIKIRDDKNIQQASTIYQIIEMYKKDVQ